MRARVLCGAVLALATNLSAQAPVTAPAAKAPKEPTKAEFRIGGFMISGERNYDFLNTVTSTAGSIKGVEILARAKGAGIYFRSLSGTFGTQPKVISADARVLLFPPVFTVFAGVGKRALSGIQDKIYDIVLAGVSSTISIGGSGLRTYISGAAIVAPDKAATGTAAAKNPSTGIEAEAAILYRLPKVPIFVSLGYRAETFTGKSGTVKSPEEVRGLRLGGGLQFGGH